VTIRQFIGAKETLQQQCAAITGIAQAHRVVRFEQPKAVRIRQGAPHATDRAHCVGLDDNQRCALPACWRATTKLFSGPQGRN
jgi:hypothetical protein